MKRYTRRLTRRLRGGNAPVRYGNVAVNSREIPIEVTKGSPTVSVPAGHFLIMWDKNATNAVGTYLHWIQGNKGPMVSYEGPAPPAGTGTHHYVFRLVKGAPKSVPGKRAAIDVAAIIGAQPVIYEKGFTVTAKSK